MAGSVMRPTAGYRYTGPLQEQGAVALGLKEAA